MPESLKNIAVLGDADMVFSTQVLEGVQAFAGRNPTWRVVPLHCTQDDLLDDLLRHGRISGVIGAFISERWIACLPGQPVPLVNIGALSNLSGVPSVIPDDVAVGRLAAGHLLDGGWRVLGCIHDVASFAASQRREGFVSAVREYSRNLYSREGRARPPDAPNGDALGERVWPTCCGGSGGPTLPGCVRDDGRTISENAFRSGMEVSEPPASESFAAGANWEEWLRGLSLPAAIFCTSDILARRLIGVLRRIERRVPEQIAVVGVGDSAFDSALAGMGISSVVLPGHRIGVRAAARLHARMEQGAEERGVEHVPPENLIVRDSSAVVWTQDAVVSRAVGLMLQRPGESLSATALAQRIGLSRRALEVRFQRALGHGPATEMRRRRLALVRRLLADTEFTLEQISDRTGFCGAHHLAALFKRTFGLTPGEHRRRSRAGQITTRT